MNIVKKLTGTVLTLSMLMGMTALPTFDAVVNDKADSSAKADVEVSAADYGLADNIQDGVILHCFAWKYSQIQEELPNIAKAGFTSVQTSPAQANNVHGTWYWLYLPRGFYVDSNDLGTKAELQSLCSEAQKYGIKVVVDVVANHLEGAHDNIVDDLKPSQYWHTHGKVNDWNNRYEVVYGDIGMADLATENSYVQGVVAKYVQELKGLGVSGLRWDAAKHIGLPSDGDQFWPAVTKYGLYNYGEILDSPPGDDKMKEYTNYMTVTDNGYGAGMLNSFNGGTAPTSIGNWSERGVPKNKLIYWGESHDTYSNDGEYGSNTAYVDQNKVDRVYAVEAAQSLATSLYFSRPFATKKEDIKGGVKGSTHFTSTEISAVNHFHNAMIGQKEYMATGDNAVAVCRQQGAVIVLGSGGNRSVTVPNGGGTCAPGTYTDEVSGGQFTVTASTISGQVGQSGIAVIYNAKKGPRASASPAGGGYKVENESDTLTVTLNLKNADSGTYSINGGAAQSFTDGQKITIGQGVGFGGKTTLTLIAKKGSESSDPETYTYTKNDKKAVQRIYFDNNGYNWSSVNAYIYADKLENAKWPGASMTKDSTTGYYVVDVPEGLENGSVIFAESATSTKNRYPADMEPGLPLGGSTKLFQNGKLSDYSPITSQPTQSQSQTQPSSIITPGKEYKYGDADLSGEVNIRDATLVQKHCVKIKTLKDAAAKAADVTADNEVNVKDATAIQKYVAKVLKAFKSGATFTYGGEQPTQTQPTQTQPTQTQPQPTVSETQPTSPPPSGTMKMTLSNNKGWSTVNCYYWSDANKAMVQWPGTAMTKTGVNEFDEGLYEIDIPSDATYVIFNDGNAQTVDIPVSGSAKFYIDGQYDGKFTVKTWT